jgi:hypothetical protein
MYTRFTLREQQKAVQRCVHTHVLRVATRRELLTSNVVDVRTLWQLSVAIGDQVARVQRDWHTNANVACSHRRQRRLAHRCQESDRVHKWVYGAHDTNIWIRRGSAIHKSAKLGSEGPRPVRIILVNLLALLQRSQDGFALRVVPL